MLDFIYNRKLSLAYAHFDKSEKMVSCLSHAKFTVLGFYRVVLPIIIPA
jgi:hypothetical protein